MAYSLLAELRHIAGFNTQQKAADYFNVSLRTYQRWEKNNSAKPYIYELLKFKAGYLKDKEFKHMRIINGAIWTQNNRPISAAQIENLSLLLEWNRDNPHYNDAITEAQKTWHYYND